MPRKGTPEYEVWKQKFLQKRKSVSTKNNNNKNSVIYLLKKNLTESLIDINDLILFIYLSNVDKDTLSVDALSAVKDKFELSDEDFSNLVFYFKTLSLDILKLRLQGVINFVNVNLKPASYPKDIQEKYNKKSFKEKYNYSLDSILKVLSL